MIAECSFWPCDKHGNKVRWPTDAEGKMLSRYGDIADAIRESVRADIRSGLTIEAIMARYDVPKRFVEDQRTAMLESEQIPRCAMLDRKRGHNSAHARYKGGYSARDRQETQVSTAYVYQQRRKQK